MSRRWSRWRRPGGGISRAVAEHALELFSGDRDVALAWVTDEGNAAEVERLEGLYDGKEGGDGGKGGGGEAMEVEGPVLPDVEMKEEGGEEEEEEEEEDMAPSPVTGGSPEGTAEEDLVLVDLVHASPFSVQGRLATLLARVEDLSHVLVWGRVVAVRGEEGKEEGEGGGGASAMDITTTMTTNGGYLVRLVLVELPRLKLTLKPREEKERGALRLNVMDHSGWFISDRFAQDPSEAVTAAKVGAAGGTLDPGKLRLKGLLGGLEASLILENAGGEIQVLVANQDAFRPPVGGEPWSTMMVFDRASLGWQQAMETRYYLYPVHTSRTFLSPPTLAASLYLILLRLLHRAYGQAFKETEACSVDVPFTAEEAWVWGQFERTLDDAHPDAHAVRLKLSLAVQYSRQSNKLKWEQHKEVDRYMAKLAHVAAACRLTYEEELDALHLSKQGTPLIKNRLAYLKAAKEGKLDVRLKTESPRWGGQPWLKLNIQTLDYLTQHGTKISRIHYRRPAPEGQVLADDRALDLLWSDLLVMDEESGANRQLGFVFLYELARGTVAVNVGGRDVGRDLAEILARFFHLKMSRWGREQVEEGEVESSNSTHLAQLAAVFASPQVAWPVLPSDGRTRTMLDRGVGLFTPEGRTSTIKAWFDMMDLQFTTTLSSPELQGRRTEALQAAMQRVRNTPLGVTTAIRLDLDDVRRARGEIVRSSNSSSNKQHWAGRAEVPRARDTSLSKILITPPVTNIGAAGSIPPPRLHMGCLWSLWQCWAPPL